MAILTATSSLIGKWIEFQYRSQREEEDGVDLAAN
jgi:hypothetical protein